MMKQSDIFRENAENCAHLAEAATDELKYLRYKRMEAAWLALANEQDWLDGETSPVVSNKNRSLAVLSCARSSHDILTVVFGPLIKADD